MVSHSGVGLKNPDDTAQKRHKGVFRPELEGLRAIGILAVMTYHAGIKIFPGSFAFIDLFFVISGFLITGLLVRELEKTKRISLSGFYARRIRRLLPAATVVLVFTTIVTWRFADPIDQPAFGIDIAASAAYVVNWVLAWRSVDYLAEDVGASPVQQFWSLAVEEQFYIVWPLVLIVVALIIRKYHRNARLTMAIGLVLIVVPSFVWSVVFTEQDPASAYFVTTTRLWELGVGGLIAVGASLWTKIPKIYARILGWSGFAVVIASALFYTSALAWPGYLALAPVLGTAAIIIAGATGAAPRLLAWGPFLWIGALSYSLYLWHWPLITAAGWIWGDFGWKFALLIVAVTFIPSWLSLRFVEDPIRFSKVLTKSTGKSISMGVVLTVVSASVGLALAFGTSSSDQNSGTSDVTGLGAETLVLKNGKVESIPVTTYADPLYPAPQNATQDLPVAYDEGCQASEATTEPIWCTFGDKKSKKRVVLAGDSKAMQWSETLSRIGSRDGWRLDTATKSRCPFVVDTVRYLNVTSNPYTACEEFNTALMEQLLADKPDAVILSQRASQAISPSGQMTREVMEEGMTKTWSTLQDNGIQVIPLLDNPGPILPAFDGQVYRCVRANPENYTPCVFSAVPAIEKSGIPIMRDVAEDIPGVEVVSMTDVFCDEKVCPPVIGNVLVYRQTTHITNTYALSSKLILQERLLPKLPFESGINAAEQDHSRNADSV